MDAGKTGAGDAVDIGYGEVNKTLLCGSYAVIFLLEQLGGL